MHMSFFAPVGTCGGVGGGGVGSFSSSENNFSFAHLASTFPDSPNCPSISRFIVAHLSSMMIGMTPRRRPLLSLLFVYVLLRTSLLAPFCGGATARVSLRGPPRFPHFPTPHCPTLMTVQLK